MAGLGHSSKFHRLSRLGFITAATSLNGRQPNFARCLAVSWAGRLYIFGGCCPVTEFFPGAKFTFRLPSLALSYIGSVTARHSSSGREPNSAALSTRRHLYSAGRPSRWALAHILVLYVVMFIIIMGFKTDCERNRPIRFVSAQSQMMTFVINTPLKTTESIIL